MTTEKPSVVLIQGSFQTPLVYAKLTTGLRDLGYPVIHPSLPSCTNVEADDFPTRTMEDDARTITETLQQLIEKEGKSVVVVMHSYGGIVGSTAIPQFLAYTSRQAEGKKGGGASVMGTFGESPNNYVTSDGRFRITNGAEILYSDLPDAEAALWESRLIPQSHLVQTTPTTRAAYEYLPSTYLICEGDQAAPVAFQGGFAKLARAEIDRCSAGHSPMLSQPEMLVGKIAAVVEKAVAAST
ncbi:Alpha/beta hydrolase fold-1 [Aspergillus welwitschiae]|uniref:Alpha/beta hydrolase fold-1 n=1 Tax=Aspergillus welwitschiae TaxID=1341132 RepID=A0A3F3PTX8_9EURO|nr:Alpha/beta hydrolase fold-1 [Aspergillus welwitschiae]RDH30325.1 Alpha/beta hydrolase fold-1 [Aspergillus welwitschiae]